MSRFVWGRSRQTSRRRQEGCGLFDGGGVKQAAAYGLFTFRRKFLHLTVRRPVVDREHARPAFRLVVGEPALLAVVALAVVLEL